MARNEQKANLEDWLTTIPDEFIQCRDVRHAWGGSQNVWRHKLGLMSRLLKCMRCGVEKEQILAKDGRVVVSRMRHYPTDYVKPKNATPGRISGVKIRLEATSRAEPRTSNPPDQLVDLMNRLMDQDRISPS